MFTTPMINIWNPICRKYQWLRTTNIFSISDNYKMYKNDTRVYIVCMTENNQCPCAPQGMSNKFLVVTDSQVFGHTKAHIPNNWKPKVKTFPEPDLGDINPYTNKYLGIDMKDLYNKMKNRYHRYIKFDEPNLKCCKELK
jgi:hypothetical protein